MEKYRHFDSAVGDERSYSAADFAEYFASIISTGVLKSELNELLVSPTGSGLNVKVATGAAFINGYFYMNDADKSIAIDPTASSRIDRIILRLNLSPSERNIKAVILKGSDSASPVAPELTQNSTIYEISLAKITITSSTTVIESSNVVSERAYATIPFIGGSVLLASNNLSDLANKVTARSNLGVLAKSNNLSDLDSKATAKLNLGISAGTGDPIGGSPGDIYDQYE